MKRLAIIIASLVFALALSGCSKDAGNEGPTVEDVAAKNQANAATPAPPLTQEEKDILAKAQGAGGGGKPIPKGTTGK